MAPPTTTSANGTKKAKATKTTPQEAAAAGRLLAILVCRALEQLKARKLDDEALRLMLGPCAYLNSIEEVALAFDVDVTTVEQWQAAGMPGPMMSGAPEPSTAPNPYFPPNARNCELLRRMQVHWELPYSAMAVVLGDELTAATQADVALAFGVGLPTVKAWVSMGMPKPAKGKPYMLIPILSWRLKADRSADTRLG